MVGTSEVMRVHRKFKENTEKKAKELSDAFQLDISSVKVTKVISDMLDSDNFIFPVRKKEPINKKGQIGFDILSLAVVIFTFGIIVMFMYMGFNPALTSISDSFKNQSYTTAGTIIDRGNSGLTSFDQTILYIVIADTIFIYASAFLVGTVFPMVAFWIGIIILALVNIFISFIGNAFASMLDDPTFLASADVFPITKFILLHLAEYSLIVGIPALLLFLFKVNNQGVQS